MNNTGHRDSRPHNDGFSHYNRRGTHDTHRRESKNITGTVARVTNGRYFISDTEGVLAKDEERIAKTGGDCVKPDRDGNITVFGFARDRDTLDFLPGDTVSLTAERSADKFTGKPIYKGQRVNLVKASQSEYAGLLQYDYIDDNPSEDDIESGKITKTIFITAGEFGRYRLPAESSWHEEKPDSHGIIIDFKVKREGSRFIPEITKVHGGGGSARTCADALFYPRKVGVDFTREVTAEAEAVSAEFEGKLREHRLPETEVSGRLDLRDTVIFTIDGKDTKDIDDAVSLCRFDDAPEDVKIRLTKAGAYVLGVHIADVSHFVKTDGAIWKEASHRTTSEYIADRVLPMLPPCLSNGVCSLNPNVDRYALSALITLSDEGELVDFAFAKTVIRSRVKGVYSELNELKSGGFASGGADDKAEKYEECLPTLRLCDELLTKLRALRTKRGALPLETTECKIVCDEQGRVLDLVPRGAVKGELSQATEIPANSGYSEELIEEFMVLANRAAAKFSVREGLAEKSGSSLPVYLYRSHAAPDVDKLKMLHDTLTAVRLISAGMKFSALASRERLAEILGKAHGTNLQYIVNMSVLRAQMKAAYTNALIGHFGLALHEYSHFTSPIRRFADLVIHHIISEVISGAKTPETVRAVMRKYRKITEDAAQGCSEREISAVRNERQCESFYKAEYMSRYAPTVAGSVERDETRKVWDGVISGFPPSENGFFVVLPNTAEGFVPLIRQGFKLTQGGTEMYSAERGVTYRLGDSVRVAVTRVSIPTGKVDFELV
ncbi:hypothetical protein FACS1894120_2590 [Clostridia bacterium]|nr:hypothetical protein FACS1894120_2590 [Clostridia bacterium]